jgi:hypothetical protein
MPDVAALFRDIQDNTDRYLGSAKGREFEDRINATLHRIGFSRLTAQDVPQAAFKALRGAVRSKETEGAIANPFGSAYDRHFFYQPNGPQDYPDFLVLAGEWCVSIEAKFSSGSQGKPVWNSGLPRPNGIYVFGAYDRKDVTFFAGGDVVSKGEVEKLHDFFDLGLRDYQRKFNEVEMSAQRYGFAVYVRKAFDQGRKANPEAVLDFFTNPDRAALEAGVLQRVTFA